MDVSAGCCVLLMDVCRFLCSVCREGGDNSFLVMQQADNGGEEEEATVDVQFTDLPNALIACKVAEDLFNEDRFKVSSSTLRPCGTWFAL